MSKNNNVNPGQYKVAGRERQGEDIVSRDHKATHAQAQANSEGKAAHAPPKATSTKRGQAPQR
jgi:hypothetical protein